MQKKDFKIENSIYGDSLIKKVIKEFDGFDIAYDNGIVTISGNNDEIQDIFNEFMNYALYLYNENN